MPNASEPYLSGSGLVQESPHTVASLKHRAEQYWYTIQLAFFVSEGVLMSVYEQVKQALQDIVAPELKALQIEIKRLDEKVDIAINIRERLVAIETELGLRKKESGKRVKAK